MSKIFDFLQNNVEVIVALCALIVAWVTYSMSKKHNYLSVKPIAYILPQDYDDNLCVILQNKGTGPLITKSIRFINDRTKEEKKYLIDLIPNAEFIGWRNFSKAQKYVLTPNENKILLHYEFSEMDNSFEENMTIVRNELKDVRIIITYHGVYNEKIDTLNFKLEWYGRHF